MTQPTMLRFQTSPDAILQLIVRDAIENVLEELAVGREAPDQDGFESLLPNASRVFDPQTAALVLKELRVCSDAAELYQPTDYHWMLLYDVLGYYCDLFNDLPEEFEPFKRYGIRQLHFGAILEKFFWDLDFLMGQEMMLELTVDQRQQLGFSHEAFGLSQGLKPHPEELMLRRIDDDDLAGVVPVTDSPWYRLGEDSYPAD